MEYAKARTAFDSAARFGHLDAMYQYAIMSPRTDPRVWIYLKRATRSGHCESYEYLCYLMEENGDIGGLIEMSKAFAADIGVAKLPASGPSPWLRKAEANLLRRATAGDLAAMNDLAALLWETGRPEEARGWFERAEHEQLRRSASGNSKRTEHGSLPEKDATEPHPDEDDAAS
ncbi:MAG TPA: tetratricopeptide repeat protein [Streptosporangiaceae bacterium]|nr:tetratricopeptide repeat protein [Streptosporangiaceae bacterium]